MHMQTLGIRANGVVRGKPGNAWAIGSQGSELGRDESGDGFTSVATAVLEALNTVACKDRAVLTAVGRYPFTILPNIR